MHMLNVLHGLDAQNRPQGFPLVLCTVDDRDMLSNSKAKIRLLKGEIIVYVDHLGTQIYVSLHIHVRPVTE
jgi:hypothetical protein